MPWRILLCLLWPGLVLAATLTPGADPPLRPGGLPDWWASWSNDAIGGEVGINPDDFRTNALAAGLRLDGLLVMVDWSHLTLRGAPGLAPARIDELSLCLGHDLVGAAGRLWLAGGVGLRLGGRLGGQDLQNVWHDVIGFETVDLPYEASRVEGLLWLRWRGLVAVGDGPGLRPGLWLDGGTMLSDRGRMEAGLGLRAALMGRDAALWLGLEQVLRQGHAPDRSSRYTARVEEGRRLLGGLAAGPLMLEASYDLGSRTSTGTIGLAGGRPDLVEELSGPPLHLVLDVSLEAYGLGLRLRQPWWQASQARLAGVVAYRWGRVPGVDLRDATLRYQQASAGLELGLGPDEWLLHPHLAGALGWRLEETVLDGPEHEVARSSLHSAMLEGEVGLRLDLARLGLPPGWELEAALLGLLPWRQRGLPRRDGGELLLGRARLGTRLGLGLGLHW